MDPRIVEGLELTYMRLLTLHQKRREEWGQFPPKSRRASPATKSTSLSSNDSELIVFDVGGTDQQPD